MNTAQHPISVACMRPRPSAACHQSSASMHASLNRRHPPSKPSCQQQPSMRDTAMPAADALCSFDRQARLATIRPLLLLPPPNFQLNPTRLWMLSPVQPHLSSGYNSWQPQLDSKLASLPACKSQFPSHFSEAHGATPLHCCCGQWLQCCSAWKLPPNPGP